MSRKSSKNISKNLSIGVTLQTRDEFLSSGKGKSNIKPDHPNKKDLYRRVAVIDSNRKDELAIVKLLSKGRHSLDNYMKGKSKYNAFVEIEDSKGKRIKVDNVMFVKNRSYRNISKKDIVEIKKNVLISKHTARSLRRENRSLLKKLKER